MVIRGKRNLILWWIFYDLFHCCPARVNKNIGRDAVRYYYKNINKLPKLWFPVFHKVFEEWLWNRYLLLSFFCDFFLKAANFISEVFGSIQFVTFWLLEWVFNFQNLPIWFLHHVIYFASFFIGLSFQMSYSHSFGQPIAPEIYLRRSEVKLWLRSPQVKWYKSP